MNEETIEIFSAPVGNGGERRLFFHWLGLGLPATNDERVLDVAILDETQLGVDAACAFCLGPVREPYEPSDAFLATFRAAASDPTARDWTPFGALVGTYAWRQGGGGGAAWPCARGAEPAPAHLTELLLDGLTAFVDGRGLRPCLTDAPVPPGTTLAWHRMRPDVFWTLLISIDEMRDDPGAAIAAYRTRVGTFAEAEPPRGWAVEAAERFDEAMNAAASPLVDWATPAPLRWLRHKAWERLNVELTRQAQRRPRPRRNITSDPTAATQSNAVAAAEFAEAMRALSAMQVNAENTFALENAGIFEAVANVVERFRLHASGAVAIIASPTAWDISPMAVWIVLSHNFDRVNAAIDVQGVSVELRSQLRLLDRRAAEFLAILAENVRVPDQEPRQKIRAYLQLLAVTMVESAADSVDAVAQLRRDLTDRAFALPITAQDVDWFVWYVFEAVRTRKAERGLPAAYRPATVLETLHVVLDAAINHPPAPFALRDSIGTSPQFPLKSLLDLVFSQDADATVAVLLKLLPARSDFNRYEIVAERLVRTRLAQTPQRIVRWFLQNEPHTLACAVVTVLGDEGVSQTAVLAFLRGSVPRMTVLPGVVIYDGVEPEDWEWFVWALVHDPSPRGLAFAATMFAFFWPPEIRARVAERLVPADRARIRESLLLPPPESHRNKRVKQQE